MEHRPRSSSTSYVDDRRRDVSLCQKRPRRLVIPILGPRPRQIAVVRIRPRRALPVVPGLHHEFFAFTNRRRGGHRAAFISHPPARIVIHLSPEEFHDAEAHDY